MTDSEALQEALLRAVQKKGVDAIRAVLLSLGADAEDSMPCLTIIGNAGMHAIPANFVHGELYNVTQGTLDLSKAQSISEFYISVLRPLADKLRERPWKRIYFVPTGPTTLALQIKLLVYNVTRISTVDLFYSKGDYYEINLDYRSYLT
jgi:hypothetical protein